LAPEFQQCRVIDFPKSRQMRKQMNDEPAKSRQITHVTLRDFKCLETPLALDLVPRLRKARRPVSGLTAPFHDLRPIFFDQRLRNERPNLPGGALAKRFETRSIDYFSLLKRRIRRRRTIESHRFKPWLAGRAARHPDRSSLH